MKAKQNSIEIHLLWSPVFFFVRMLETIHTVLHFPSHQTIARITFVIEEKLDKGRLSQVDMLYNMYNYIVQLISKTKTNVALHLYNW